MLPPWLILSDQCNVSACGLGNLTPRQLLGAGAHWLPHPTALTPFSSFLSYGLWAFHLE